MEEALAFFQSRPEFQTGLWWPEIPTLQFAVIRGSLDGRRYLGNLALRDEC